MKRYACCYCRYSSDKQQQQSIDFQLQKIEEFCDKYGITLIEKYIDEAMTGTNDQRKEFQRMIEDSAHSKWGYLLVYETSRLARNVEDQMFYQKILKQRGIMVISVEEKFDSTPEGHLFSLITAGINEYYSKHLAKRSFAGVVQNAKKGLVIGGIPPLGFDVDDAKRYIINKKEAEAVRIIFEKTLEGWSQTKIRDYLNASGYVTKLGRPFTQSLHDILINRKYCGEYIFNVTDKKRSRGARVKRSKSEDEIIRIPGGLPQIVDKITFEKVQHLINKRRKHMSLAFRPSRYLLTGRLVCGKCGRAMSGSTVYGTNRKYVYMNYVHKNYSHGFCDVKEIPIQYLDNWVTKVVIPDFLSTKDLTNRVVEINNQIMEERNLMQSSMKELRKKIEDIDSIISSKGKNFVNNQFSILLVEEVNLLKEEKSKLIKEKVEIEKRYERLKRVNVETLKAYLLTIQNEIVGDDNIVIVEKVISKIIVENELLKVFINYDMITGKLCNFDIEISKISRETLMKTWRKTKKDKDSSID